MVSNYIHPLQFQRGMALEKIKTNQSQLHHPGMLNVGCLIHRILKQTWVGDAFTVMQVPLLLCSLCFS